MKTKGKAKRLLTMLLAFVMVVGLIPTAAMAMALFCCPKPDDDLKYNEGALVGEWVKFPTTAEELQKVFERIGIGSKDDFGHPYEEWFITDYRIMNDAT